MKKWLYFSLFIFWHMQAQGGEVVLFEEPPSVKEILESFGEPVRKTRGDKKSRKVVMNDAPAEVKAEEVQEVQSEPEVTQVKTFSKPKKHHQVPVAFPLTFSAGSAELSKDSQHYIDSIAAALKEKSDLSVRISGHTDMSGGDEVNKPLSLKRAESVKNYLKTAHQIDSSRLDISGEGSSFPLDLKNPQSPANRRVQFDRVIKSN